MEGTAIKETQGGTEQKAQDLLEEKDAESRTRTYQGPMGAAVTCLLCAWAAFQLYFTTFGVISAVNLRAFHCIFLLCFAFLLYPTCRKKRRTRYLPPLWDVLLIVLACFTFGYLILNYTRVAQNGGRLTPFELVIAGVGVALAFEAARRTSGNLMWLPMSLSMRWLFRSLSGWGCCPSQRTCSASSTPACPTSRRLSP